LKSTPGRQQCSADSFAQLAQAQLRENHAGIAAKHALIESSCAPADDYPPGVCAPFFKQRERRMMVR